jgi:hypothetical protein
MNNSIFKEIVRHIQQRFYEPPHSNRLYIVAPNQRIFASYCLHHNIIYRATWINPPARGYRDLKIIWLISDRGVRFRYFNEFYEMAVELEHDYGCEFVYKDFEDKPE